ncbi:MAG: hypothetical protein DU429_02910 [Candidatus Tokpelaia sp.]|nr:MAG: hypothetical protein DU430_05665 [Candidatus Tokpelaia sp.]KAA6207417.1 MAG: hypothetical protein DU429_02910 [Candidatus Tokpelaia sp.]KAA6405074.1 hypothetical protein DPQ22_05785 [Candidatus Tokpelaia sp.]
MRAAPLIEGRFFIAVLLPAEGNLPRLLCSFRRNFSGIGCDFAYAPHCGTIFRAGSVIVVLCCFFVSTRYSI